MTQVSANGNQAGRAASGDREHVVCVCARWMKGQVPVTGTTGPRGLCSEASATLDLHCTPVLLQGPFWGSLIFSMFFHPKMYFGHFGASSSPVTFHTAARFPDSHVSRSLVRQASCTDGDTPSTWGVEGEHRHSGLAPGGWPSPSALPFGFVTCFLCLCVCLANCWCCENSVLLSPR